MPLLRKNMISEKSKQTIEALEQGRYLNTREIHMGDVSFTARDILVKAPLISGLNAYYVGGTGEGKTQLGHDLLSLAGGQACYANGRPDFEPAELLRQINLDNLRKAKTDKELVHLTDNVRKNLFFVDELNRCPPIVQNYFFDFFDGKIIYDGKILKLGDGKYSVGFATGNLGDGEYVGVSDSDRALLDRLHLIIKLDHPDYRPTDGNLLELFMSGKKNPRADMPEQSKVNFQDVLALNEEFASRPVDLTLPALGLYFARGLDYLENVKGHSKKAFDTRWPTIDGIRTDNDENKVFPTSPRAVFSAMGISSALEMIAEAKGKNPNRVKLFLDSLRMIMPYSGVIAKPYLEQEHNGSVYSAFDELFGEGSANRRDILDKSSALEASVCYALGGIKNQKLLKEIAPLESRWTAVARGIGELAEKRADSKDEESIKVKEILKKAKTGGN